jgi:hypothetical protein
MRNVILEKTANALYPDASVDWWWGLTTMITAAVSKRTQGGLWVGGTFRADSEWLSFEPNTLNTTFQSRIDPVRIHVSELRNIRRDSGWVTDIIVIEHARGEFKFRCFGAEEVVNTLNSYYFRTVR